MDNENCLFHQSESSLATKWKNFRKGKTVSLTEITDNLILVGRGHEQANGERA